MSTLSRQPTYVGREVQKGLIRRWAQSVAAGGACRALCFEATGGLGKTRLLQALPEIVGRACPEARFAPVVDLYDVEHRGAEAIERRLIDGLALRGSSTRHGIPPHRVAAAFAAYHRLAAETLADRQFGDPESRLAHGARLRAAFVAGWNSLAADWPLVLRFDTLEALAAPPAPPQALVSAARALTERDLVGGWMRAVLPRLRRTLVVLSGRPPGEGVHPLVAQIAGLGLLAEPVQRLEPLDDADEIRAYLRGHGLEVGAEQIPLVRRLTEGRPLLLTCWAAATCAEPPLRPPPELGSRAAFEDWLVDTVLDPLAPVGPAERTVAYSLYALSYARGGLRPLELAALLARLGLHCDGAALARIGDLALVKAVDLPHGDTLLLLHDEVYQLIDQSGRPDDLGLREPALAFLCELARAQVNRAGDRIALLRAMADHVSYELRRDPAAGYGSYAVYVERLLREHNVEEAALLSELFWAALTARGRRGGQALTPLLAALRERGLSYEGIVRDEEARAIWLLHAQEQHQLAADAADRQIAALAAAGAPLLAGDDLPPAELRRHVALALAWAVAAARARPPEDHELILDRCARAIAALEPVGEDCPDRLLELRRDALLGQAHLTRGQIHVRQLRFAEALADADAAAAALRRHEARAAAGPHDPIAYNRLAVSNLAISLLTLGGDLEGALRASAEMLGANLGHASPYHRALYACQHAALLLRSGEELGLEGLLAHADEAALASGSKRAKGLLAHCRGVWGHQRMLAAGVPNPVVDRHFAEAATLLHHEPGPRLDVCRDWAAFDLDLAALYEAERGEIAARRHRLLAADLLDEYLARADELPPLHAAELLALRAAAAPPAEAAALLAAAEARLTAPLPPYAHLIRGRIALRRAAIAPDDGGRLGQLALALANMAAFAPRHADMDGALRHARAWAGALPGPQRAALAEGLAAPAPAAPAGSPSEAAWARAWGRAVAELGAILAVSAP